MSRRISQGQSSRKGISDIFVYMLILLIAVFSGLIVYYMASSLINDFIIRTLGIRLTLHGLGLYYNTLYALPSGLTTFESTFPPQCEMKCIDCSYFTNFFIPVPQVYCDCENVDESGLPIAEGGEGSQFKNLLSTYPNQEALVCDDYILTNVDPVILYVGKEPVSAAIRLNLLIHPESELFLSFADYIMRAVGAEVDFFKSQLTVYSEMPINLNDYAGVRRLLTNAPRGDFSNMIHWDDDELLIFKTSYDNYESVIGEVGDIQGLIGVLEKVFYHVSNKSIGDDVENYCGVSGGGGDGKGNRGVECPGSDGVIYPLMIKPGLKINKTGSKLCEYECYQQNTLDTVCPNGVWDEVFCFDFAEVNAIECPNCSADDVTYEFDLCDGDECMGATSPDISKDYYVDIVTGSPADLDSELNMTIIPDININVCRQELFGTTTLYEEVVARILDSCDNIDSDDLISDKCNNIDYDPDDGSLIEVLASCDDLTVSWVITSDYLNDLSYWPPYPSELRDLGDCALTLSCDSENSDIFTITIIDNADEIDCDHFGVEEAYTDVCDLTKGLWITRFSACGSKGVYEFSFSDATHLLELKDVPAMTFFKSLLSESSLIRETYKVLPFGDCSGGDFEVVLEPIGEADIFSKSVKVPYADLHDRKFELKLSNSEESAYTTQGDCEAASFEWNIDSCFDMYDLNVAIKCVENCI